MGSALHAAPLPLWAATMLVVVASALVAASAHWIVESAVRLARDLRVSATLVGLTVVALGTSAPEFAVTLVAAFEGRGSISIGNVVGSNIFNLGFILGGVALVQPFRTDRRIVWRDGSVLALSTLVLLAFVGVDLTLDRLEGVVLFGALVAYLTYLGTTRDRSGAVDPALSGEEVPEEDATQARAAVHLARLATSLVLIGVSAHLLIYGGTSIATALGMSDWVIAVTIIAAGTSLPEFATSLVAVLRGRPGIGLGNIIGSDIFNVLGVLGLTGMIRAVDVDPAARVSLAGLCMMVFFVVVFMRSGWRLSRLEALALVGLASARWVLDLAGGP